MIKYKRIKGKCKIDDFDELVIVTIEIESET
jgi:hypothetical protein